MSVFPSRPGPNKFRLVPVEPVVVPPIPVPESTKYGILYNWYAATDIRNICADGWHVTTVVEHDVLRDYLGGWNVAGHKIREVGTVYWNAPNTGATNEVGFNARGSGFRLANGVIGVLKNNIKLWTVDGYDSTRSYAWINTVNSGTLVHEWREKKAGCAIRPIKDFTVLSHGETGFYTDPSGYTYPTICIGTQEWVSCNIKTQHYRNGDPIPEVTDNAAWAALTSGALCAYNNDWDNV